ncbi:MAG: OmpH family outer membrane protein [Flavobacteriales bacterium]|nr:OmpH family outer membrane protein [Flavobacteriales bacterium]
MKKILLALLVVCSVGSVMAQSKVAHVNSQVLLDTMPSRKAAITKLQEFESAGRNELQEMNADFEKSYNVFMANQSTWSPVILKIEEEKLMKKQQNLQEREQSLQQEMQVYSQELNNPILEMVQKAVKEVSEKNKINYVIDESVTLYFAGGTDITKEVITVLLRMDQQ